MKETINSAAYEAKEADYFSGQRLDFLSYLENFEHKKILEVGCGDGINGELAKARLACEYYAGIELFDKAASIAQSRIDKVLIGDVEKIDIEFPNEYFDVIIMSEVLEHLSDPWATVQKLSKHLKHNGLFLASSPNISNWRVVYQLIKGNWELTNSGVMDRTHLRWFTPKSYKSMFEGAGFTVEEFCPSYPYSWKARLIDKLSGGNFTHLFITQMNIYARKSAVMHKSD